MAYCLNIFSEIPGWQTSYPGSLGQQEGATTMGATALHSLKFHCKEPVH